MEIQNHTSAEDGPRADFHYDVLVVGAGPSGLMAAEQAALAGLRVAIADAMPSPARKFLMAGKSGLNLTKHEDLASFIKNYDAIEPLRPMLNEFGPKRNYRFCAVVGSRGFHRKHGPGVSKGYEGISPITGMACTAPISGRHTTAQSSLGRAYRNQWYP